MGRARSAIAARTSVDALEASLLEAFASTKVKSETHEDFYDAMSFCRDNSEEFNGEEGHEGWYLWQVGDWAVAGDISMQFCESQPALQKLSESVGELVSAGIDTGFEFAHFSVYTNGQIKRLLTLEDDELVEDGFPVEAERGQQMNDFDEQEAERLWTSYGLPTFEHDPLDGPFLSLAVKR